jgi:hypothetical protein
MYRNMPFRNASLALGEQSKIIEMQRRFWRASVAQWTSHPQSGPEDPGSNLAKVFRNIHT